MPIRTTYRHNNVSEPDKKTFTVSNFKGVDYTPGQLNVDDFHATEISNIIYKDKVNQKRNGWEQIGKVGAVTYRVKNDDGTYTQKENTTNINGVWFFKEDSTEYKIAHIGKLLFKIDGLGKNKSFLEFSLTPITKSEKQADDTYINFVEVELNDAPSIAFYGSKRLYILDGQNYIVLKLDGSNSIDLVEDDEETYIPTTTIGITDKNSSIKMAAPLDDVNLLTQWRKNKLVSGTYVDDGVSLQKTQFWDYELDTAIVFKNPSDINDIEIVVKTLEITKE